MRRSAIKKGDRFEDQYGVWIVDGPAYGTVDMWEIYLSSRGKGHAKVESGSALLKHYTKKRTNTRTNPRPMATNTRRTRKNPTVPDVWGLPANQVYSYGSKVVPHGKYKTLPLPAIVNTELYYEAPTAQGGVATLTVKRKGAGSYYLTIGGGRSRWGNTKEAREDIQYFLESGRLPGGRSQWANPSRGTFKAKTYAYYTVARRLLTSGHKTRAQALKQANGRKANVKTAAQAKEYLGRKSDGQYRSLTSSSSWYSHSR
jgi:hypothetical protein